MNFKKRTSRKSRNMNTSSTADISFLLLIFFLLTTTAFADFGIPIKLTPYSCGVTHTCGSRRHNILRVTINSENQLLVGSELSKISNLKRDAKEFILNQRNSRNPRFTFISLQGDRGTSYETYFNAYNELRSAYHEIWNEVALQEFGFRYKHLNNERKQEVKRIVPMILSEAEPTDFLVTVK